jgi:Uma2 family endonuclease
MTIRHESLKDSPPIRHFSVQDYHYMGESGILKVGERLELIAGEIIQMSPIECLHADWVDRLTRFFIKKLPETITVRTQNPIHLDNYNEPQPDLALVRSRVQPYCEAHPTPQDILLIIEVAETTLHYDRYTKIPLYAKHNIPEVWLFDLQNNQLEIYRAPQEGDYHLILKPLQQEQVTLIELPEVNVVLAQLFV